MKEAKKYPGPKYDKCNKGHMLVQLYDSKKHTYVWDCPICIKEMGSDIILIKRVEYGSPETAFIDRVYRAYGVPNAGVGTIQEFEEAFPNKRIMVVE